MHRAPSVLAALLGFPVGAGLSAAPALAADPCPFDHQQLTYEGSPKEQAHCLLRHVRRYGELDVATALPEPLEALVGQSSDIRVAQLMAYLRAHGLSDAVLGGPLALPLSLAMAGDPRAPRARYFVIHDTSTPALGAAPFPDDLNSPSWAHNQLDSWIAGDKSRAHVFISRTGESVTAVDFSEPWRATKFEMQDTLLRRKGLFLHIELVMPRRNDPSGPATNDALAPEPGIAPAQYARLALVYAAASVRAGHWLIPAFHAVLDAGRVDAHDDPQNFSLESFAAALALLRQQVAATVASGTNPE